MCSNVKGVHLTIDALNDHLLIHYKVKPACSLCFFYLSVNSLIIHVYTIIVLYCNDLGGGAMTKSI